MGGGGSKTHESFTVTPGGTESLPDADALEGDPPPPSPLLDQVLQQLASFPEAPGAGAGGDWAAGYAALVEEHTKARDLVGEALLAGASAEELEAARAPIKAATKAWLDQVPPDELNGLAAATGFEHPGLVGLGDGPSPLVHWLDPAYPAGIPSKAKIQAKALDRHAALCAGETVGGLTLATYNPSGAPPDGGGGGEWAATPADVVAAQSTLASRLVELKAAGVADQAQAVAELIGAENHLATASCPELGDHLTTAKAAGRSSVDAALGGLGHPAKAKAEIAVANGVADGTLTSDQAKVLAPGEALSLCRRSTPDVVRDTLTAAAAERSAQMATLNGLVASHTAVQASAHGPLALPDLHGGVGDPGKTALVSFAGDAGQLYPLVAATSKWRPAAIDAGPVPYLGSAEELTTNFRAWAKTQKLNDLRDAAAALGHPEGLAATRAQAQNLIASTWDPSINAATITASIKPKPQPAAAKPAATKPSAPKPASPAKPAVAAKPPATSNPAGSVTSPAPAGPSGKSWAAKHLQLVEALKHHTASTADLPARQDPAAVSTWAFKAAPVQSLGGAHSKSFHTAPDGTTWMFKPDKTGGGARAHAEAAASEVFAKVGVPSVPVYARDLGGKPGSIQPLLSGATNLGASPASWSQADVDAVVRYHVAAWACGDHDGKPDNLLRTAGGGLVPVDQGQAFKFFGRDHLATSYHPNGGHGVGQAVFHQAYKAAKTGGLAKGVTVRPEAALPVLAAFERLPEASYRAMLGPTATEGAKHKVTWYEPMRARAAKTLGKTPAAVTASEVADAFLDTAVERKKNLRGAFSKFFAAEGFAGAATITKVA